MVETEKCVGCGARVPRIEGPTHRYMIAAPGCWALFLQLTATMRSRPALRDAQQQVVDAYATQHPGNTGAPAVLSVAVHLIALYSYLEAGLPIGEAPTVLIQAGSAPELYRWLSPPTFDGVATVLDVVRMSAPADQARAAAEWAEASWDAWRTHHDQVRLWYRATIRPKHRAVG
jgi:hypothetical protein